MKKITHLLVAIPFLISACTNSTNVKKENAAAPAAEAATKSTDEYFNYTIDGKEMTTKADDVSTSFNTTDATFKIFAGAEGSPSVNLTVPTLPNCPCSIAAGGPAGNMLSQGSVSLQNYPEKGNVENSWYNGLEGTPPAAAITITDVGTPVDGYRYISGKFDVTILKSTSNGDGPGNKDYKLVGKFRVKHDLHGSTSF